MDAVKFLLEFDRMCRSCQGCAGCPAIGSCDCSRESVEDLKRLVGIVERWSKDHPQKTRLQDFRERYPNAVMKINGVPLVCCENLGYCKECDTNIGCVKCWNAPMEEE